MTPLTFYEQTGIVIPGAVLLFCVAVFVPELKSFLGADGLTIGGLGLFVILSYAVGHAVAALGNVLEALLWWPLGGMPSNWVTRKTPRLLAATQITALESKIGQRLGLAGISIPGMPRKEWSPISGQVYRDVLASNPGRLATFNGNYGLNRGLAAALLCVVVLVLWLQPANRGVLAIGAATLSVIFAYRAYRFGVHFAKELYLNFLNAK